MSRNSIKTDEAAAATNRINIPWGIIGVLIPLIALVFACAKFVFDTTTELEELGRISSKNETSISQLITLIEEGVGAIGQPESKLARNDDFEVAKQDGFVIVYSGGKDLIAKADVYINIYGEDKVIARINGVGTSTMAPIKEGTRWKVKAYDSGDINIIWVPVEWGKKVHFHNHASS